MRLTPKLSRRARWAVPAAALVVTGGVMAGSLIPAAQAAPALPPRTAAELLAIAAQDSLPPLSGTVTETVSLGLPKLPDTADPTSISSMLTGSHAVQVWYASPGHFRLALPDPLSETDVIADGSTLWLWQSTKNAVTKITVPRHHDGTVPRIPQALLTPQQAAQQVLAKVGPTTAVSVDTNAMVAGQPAYQLVLAPKDHRSLVGRVLIAIDANNGLPLQVQVLAHGASSPAISVGYTTISFGAPPAAQTRFTPPPGATVTTVNPAAAKDRGRQDSAPAVTTIGTGWLTVVDLPSSALTSAAQAPVQAGGTPDDSARVLRLLLGSASPVHGAWGSGRLLRTALVSVLMTDTGRTFAGAVQPSVLYAAALQAAAAQHR